MLPSTSYRAAAFVAAARRLGVALTVASERPSTFEQALPENLLTLNFSDPSAAARDAVTFARAHPVAGVVGVDDETAVVAAAIATALDVPGNRVAAAMAARDKRRQRELLAAAAVPVPRFASYPRDADPRLVAAGARYPCVLKPIELSGSRGVIRADTAVEFERAFERLVAILRTPEVDRCGESARAVLVEDFVPGAEVALEGLLHRGRLAALALFDKPDPLDGPFFEETIYVTPSRLPAAAQSALIATAAAAARALGLEEGPVHAELRVNASGPWLIELAARPIGGRCSAALRFTTPEASDQMLSLEEIVLANALNAGVRAPARESLAAGVMMIPVPGAGELVEVEGVARARAVAFVEDVAITAHRGQRLVPLPEGSGYPGFIFARGPTPEVVEAALRAAHSHLLFRLTR
ncbi:MAG TPA: ATP-grasp domain-containing protein [Gemmatimonadales bacterium]|nr:ATP-grasp domain-containing protein [Gemmatimonadales bacterium]